MVRAYNYDRLDTVRSGATSCPTNEPDKIEIRLELGADEGWTHPFPPMEGKVLRRW